MEEGEEELRTDELGSNLFTYKEQLQKLGTILDYKELIPSMVDGLKPIQRKILFCFFKRQPTPLSVEGNLIHLIGYVTEHSAYRHGDQSVFDTIVGMAQDFVGSNNINLLLPSGQYGNRNEGGKVYGESRKLYAFLSDVARLLFPKADDILLDYLHEEGKSIEPTWYVPIIPMVLVNGVEGIGSGWSTSIPTYNPRDIIANLKRKLNGEPMDLMVPWYRGFKGTIEINKKDGCYTSIGVIEEVNKTTLKISELPVGKWTKDYKEFLESITTENGKGKDRFIKSYRENGDDRTINFEIRLTKENMEMVKRDGLYKKFELTTIINTDNMILFDDQYGVIKKYKTPAQILEDFFDIRLEFYKRRKIALLEHLEEKLVVLDNKLKFILGVAEQDIAVGETELLGVQKDLTCERFIESLSEKNARLIGNERLGESFYECLRDLRIGTLTRDKIPEHILELQTQKRNLEAEVAELKGVTEKSMWLKDLGRLENWLDFNYE